MSRPDGTDSLQATAQIPSRHIGSATRKASYHRYGAQRPDVVINRLSDAALHLYQLPELASKQCTVSRTWIIRVHTRADESGYAKISRSVFKKLVMRDAQGVSIILRPTGLLDGALGL